MPVSVSCGGRTRTCDFWVMSPARCQLLHTAMSETIALCAVYHLTLSCATLRCATLRCTNSRRIMYHLNVYHLRRTDQQGKTPAKFRRERGISSFRLQNYILPTKQTRFYPDFLPKNFTFCRFCNGNTPFCGIFDIVFPCCNCRQPLPIAANYRRQPLPMYADGGHETEK